MRDSARALRARGARVYFIGDEMRGELPECDGSLLVPGLSSLNEFSPRAAVLESRARVRGFIDDNKANLVHLIEQFEPGLESMLCENYPTVLSAHTVAPTCPASTRVDAAGNICERRSGWSCLWQHHRQGCLSHFKTDLHRAHAVYGYRRRRGALREARAVIAVSRYLERLLIADGWPADKVKLVYNPVTAAAPVKPAVGLPNNLIVCAARLVAMKGIDRLLRALAPLASEEWTLWVCGEGPAREALSKLRDALRLGERVVFRGRLAYQEMPGTLAGSAFLVQPNLGPEGFGLSVAEASLAGIPVVAFGVPALDEIVVPGENGLLANPGDIDDLTRQLRRALTDRTFRERCRERGPRLMRERFSLEAHAEATWRVYEHALGGTINTRPSLPQIQARPK